MANDRFQALRPLKDSKLGGQWKEKKKRFDLGSMHKHTCLVVNGKTFLLGGQWKKKKHYFHLLPLFSPKDIS
jgi:hypothetical protein